MKWISINDSLCVYYEVNDEQLRRISEEPDYYLDGKFADEIVNATGENAVIALIIIGDKKDINVGRKKLKEKYKSVSFWNRKHQKFYQWRKKCTASQSLETQEQYSQVHAMTP